LRLIYIGCIGSSLATLLKLLDLGIVVVQICYQTLHAIDIILEVEDRGLSLHTWDISDVFTREVTELPELRELTTVLYVFWSLLQTLSILFLVSLVLLSHPLLLLLLKVSVLELLADLRNGDHLTSTGIEILNVYVLVPVNIDIRIE
jgi:hypothetical protein